ncbi:MAG: hypothetical protein ACI4XJ_05135 [Eubacteriales bacterium]
MKKHLSAAILAISAALLLSSCSENTENAAENDSDTAPQTEQSTSAESDASSETAEEETESEYDDDLEEYDFNAEDFKIQTFEDVNIHNRVEAEMDGTLLNDAIYQRNRLIEERFNVCIKEVLTANYSHDQSKSILIAGDADAFDLFSERCSDALSNWQEGLVYSYEDIPVIDLSKPYWSQSMNKSITLAGQQYVALGAFNLNTYDITHTVLFNKEMFDMFTLENPYDLVNEGEWTFDKMQEMMTLVISDLDGNGTMDGNDRYGYVAGPKQVLPSFWIAADTLSIGKDENDIPCLAMNDEHFIDAFNKIFSMLWDGGTYYMPQDTWTDVPQEGIDMFANNQSLFIDVTLFAIERMRNIETDFGILPYPKYDENQSSYVSRTEYYWTFQVPVISKNLEKAGVMLEALNSYSAKIVIPPYYELALKKKISRDNESQEMLDIILSTAVIDLGDTILCANIRDGFMKPMFEKNDRNIVSKFTMSERILKKFIEGIPQNSEE